MAAPDPLGSPPASEEPADLLQVADERLPTPALAAAASLAAEVEAKVQAQMAELVAAVEEQKPTTRFDRRAMASAYRGARA
jgi:hypothetical protein